MYKTMRKMRLFYLLGLLFCMPLFSLAQPAMKLDAVARKHYSTKEMAQLSLKDVEKINFYFTKSFTVNTASTGYKKWLQDHDGVFDITVFENYRRKSERFVVKREDYPGLEVELISLDELLEQYSRITQ